MVRVYRWGRLQFDYCLDDLSKWSLRPWRANGHIGIELSLGSVWFGLTLWCEA